jgi:hypothetical protein
VLLDVIWSIGYADELAYECRLSGRWTRCCRCRCGGCARRRGRDHRGADRRPRETDGLLRDAVHVLVDNWHGHSTVPSRGLYPHQWSWDSAFIALGLRHWAPKRAATELLSLFGAQWSDGRIPHIAFNPAVDPHAYFPGPRPSGGRRTWSGHPPIDTSGIIQPPVHATAAVAVVDGLGEDGAAFARRAYPCLLAQHDYLRRRRSVGRRAGRGGASVGDRDGQLAGVGHTAARGAGGPVAVRHLHPSRPRARRDRERPTTRTTPATSGSPWRTGTTATTTTGSARESEFCVVDPTFNALWAWAEIALADLAERIGADPTGHRAEAARLTRPWSTSCGAPRPACSWPATSGPGTG